MDTLIFIENNTLQYQVTDFSLNKTEGINIKEEPNVKKFEGTWLLLKNVIYLNFNDSLHKPLFGGCKTLTVTSIPFQKRALMRNTCYHKTPSVPIFFGRVSK